MVLTCLICSSLELRSYKFFSVNVIVHFCLQLFGASLSEGVFVGSFLSMSSTAVVCFYPISQKHTVNIFISGF